MSEIESARRKLQISGYQHPTEIIPKKSKQYKIFNTESKTNDYTKPSKFFSYATFTDKESEQKLYKQSNICPVCRLDALYVCDCQYADKQCSNGHVWFINKNNNVSIGDPHD